MDDPIVDAVHRAREEITRRLDFDLHAIFTDVRKREKSLGTRLVSKANRAERDAHASE